MSLSLLEQKGVQMIQETVILNDVAVCKVCGDEFYPDMSYHNDATKCDSCIEYEIDRVYSNKGNPWEDFESDVDENNDVCPSICENCGYAYDIDDEGSSLDYCANCTRILKEEERKWEEAFGDTLGTKTRCICGKIFHYDARVCYYGDSMYHCPECTADMVKESPDIYMNCSECGDYFCAVHVGTDRRKKLCEHCNFDNWRKSDKAKYSDDTVTDSF